MNKLVCAFIFALFILPGTSIADTETVEITERRVPWKDIRPLDPCNRLQCYWTDALLLLFLLCCLKKERERSFLFPDLGIEGTSLAVAVFQRECSRYLPFAHRSGYEPAHPPGILPSLDSVISTFRRGRTDTQLTSLFSPWFAAALHELPAIHPFHPRHLPYLL